MAASYGKLSTEHRELIFAMKRAGRTNVQVVAALKRGSPNAVPPLEPVELTAQAVSAAYKKLTRERDHLYSAEISKLAEGDGMDLILRRLLDIADREAILLAEIQSTGKLRGARVEDLGRLARAMQQIHKLAAMRGAEPNPGAEPAQPGAPTEADRPSTVAETLLAADAADPPPGPAAAGNGTSPLASEPTGDGHRDTVPSDLPEHRGGAEGR